MKVSKLDIDMMRMKSVNEEVKLSLFGDNGLENGC